MSKWIRKLENNCKRLEKNLIEILMILGRKLFGYERHSERQWRMLTLDNLIKILVDENSIKNIGAISNVA
jgi:hypothetical protein